MNIGREWIVAWIILAIGLCAVCRANEEAALGNDFQQDVNVKFVASLGGEVGAILKSGKLVYLGQGNRLRVIDIASNPPCEIGTLYLDHIISSIAQYRSYLYIFAHRYWNGYGVLKIVDVADPAHPQLKRDFILPEWAGREYLDPAILWNYLIVLGHVYDLKQAPLNPESSEIHHPQRQVILDYYEKHAPPERDFDKPLLIPDILKPLIQLVEPKDIQVEGNYAYVIDEGILKTVEIAEPEKARVVNALRFPASLARLSIKESAAYAVDTSSTVYRLNMANPVAPSMLGSIRLETEINDLDSTGSFVYLATKNGVQVIDFTQGNQPRMTDEVKMEHTLQSIRISGERAWISDGAINSLDLRKPGYPVLQTTQIHVPLKPVNPDLDDDPDRAHDSWFGSVQVQKEHVYALEHGAGGDDYTVDVYDMRKPFTITLINRLGRGDYYHRFDNLITSGNDLIIHWHGHNSKMSYDGLSIFDITDPAKKHEIAQYVHLQEAYKVVARGDMIYVADWKCGLVFLKLKRPGMARK